MVTKTMGNRRRSEVLDMLIDTILLNGPIKRTELPKETGIAMRTIDEWINLISKIQEMPRLVIDGEGRGMLLSLDVSRPEEAHLENAMAFFSQAGVEKPEEEISIEMHEEVLPEEEEFEEETDEEIEFLNEVFELLEESDD